MKPQRFNCSRCGRSWIGKAIECPGGCDAIAKSDGEFTRKTFQGDDTDLKKGLR